MATITISIIAILLGIVGIIYALLFDWELWEKRKKFKKRRKDWEKKIEKDHPEIRHADITFNLEPDMKKLFVLIRKGDSWHPIESLDLTDEELPLVQDSLIKRNEKLINEEIRKQLSDFPA